MNPEQNLDFENSLPPWLGKTVKLTQYHMHQAFIEAGLDLTKEQMIVLKKLDANDGLNQNELALLVLRDKSSLARLLTKMEKKGYINRRQSPEDKRCNQIFLTEHGRTTFAQCKPILKNLMTTVEKGITASEKQLIISILKRVQTNLGFPSETL